MPNEVFRPKKTFTLKEANQTLPLVRKIVEDIARVHGEILETQAKAEALAAEGRAVRAEEAQDRLADLSDHVYELAEELASVGCLLKDPAQGLVDFPARLDGRIVFLCWKSGEPEIRFWHEVDSGFAGRRPVRGLLT